MLGGKVLTSHISIKGYMLTFSFSQFLFCCCCYETIRSCYQLRKKKQNLMMFLYEVSNNKQSNSYAAGRLKESLHGPAKSRRATSLPVLHCRVGTFTEQTYRLHAVKP